MLFRTSVQNYWVGKKFRGVLATSRVLFRPNLIHKELVTLIYLWYRNINVLNERY